VSVSLSGVDPTPIHKNGAETSVRIDGRLRIPLIEGAITVAIAGMGVVSATTVAVRQEVGNGSLVEVLPDWNTGAVDLHAIIHCQPGTPSRRRRLSRHPLP